MSLFGFFQIRCGWLPIAQMFQDLLQAGDVMLSSAFVSYIGAFDAAFRQKLCYNTWLPDLTEKGVLTTEGVDPPFSPSP